jgi:hypothetical protein
VLVRPAMMTTDVFFVHFAWHGGRPGLTTGPGFFSNEPGQIRLNYSNRSGTKDSGLRRPSWSSGYRICNKRLTGRQRSETMHERPSPQALECVWRGSAKAGYGNIPVAFRF